MVVRLFEFLAWQKIDDLARYNADSYLVIAILLETIYEIELPEINPIKRMD